MWTLQSLFSRPPYAENSFNFCTFNAVCCASVGGKEIPLNDFVGISVCHWQMSTEKSWEILTFFLINKPEIKLRRNLIKRDFSQFIIP